ncbi:MAG: hypothetical protein PHD33_03970 [Atribacterota bacterium]|nr:hypothetical protein [Atribacterota bacterium]
MYTYLFPAFLKLDLVIWAILIIVFALFTLYINKLPADAIKKSNAQAIENKKRLGIKIYKI